MTQFERALLDALLAGDHRLSGALRQQLAAAVPVSRELSGVGFFLNFEVPGNLPPVEPRDFHVGSVYFDLKGVEHGAFAVLFVREGYLSCLEACTYHGDWPSDPLEYQIRASDEPRDPLHSYKQLKAAREARRE